VIYELVATAGLRRGEACALRWCDLDLDRRRLTVVQALLEVASHTDPSTGAPRARATWVETPKSADSARVVDLDARTVGALLAWNLTQASERAAWGDAYVARWQEGLEGTPAADCSRAACTHWLVFTREDGRFVRPGAVSQRLGVIAARAGLPAKRLHDLRHGSASLQLAAGVPRSLSSLSGWDIAQRRSPATRTATSWKASVARPRRASRH